jgi:hypothetical protein
MMNLIIGLAIGIGSAVVLGFMWRMAERLRAELEKAESRSDGTNRPNKGER